MAKTTSPEPNLPWWESACIAAIACSRLEFLNTETNVFFILITSFLLFATARDGPV